MTCDYPASANSLNVLGTLYDLSAEECQQACLARKDCLSFGVVPNSNGLKKWTNCNLLKTYTKGNVFASSDSGLISDRDCQTNRPKGCASKQFARANAAPVAVRDAAPAMITLAPIAAGEVIKEEMAKQEKALEKRQKDPAEWPTWLQSLGIIPVFLGCSCVVTEAAPTVHETVTLVVPIYSTTSVSSIKFTSTLKLQGLYSLILGHLYVKGYDYSQC